jgi:MFS family permease
MVKELGLDPKFFGVVLAIQGIGGLVGGAMANRISTKFTRGRALASVMIMASFLTLFTGFVTSIELFIALAVLSTFGSTIWNILLMSTYQLLIPNHLYGRIHGARRTIVWGTIPIGSVFGGFLATFGLRTPLIVGGLGLIVVTTVAFKFIVRVTNSTLEHDHEAGHEASRESKSEK